MAKKLIAGKELAYLSKELADIWVNAPLKLDLNEVDGTKCKPDAIMEIFKKLEFRTLARQLPDIMQVSEVEGDIGAKNIVAATVKAGKNTLIDSDDKLEKLDLDGKKEVVMHSRCSGKHGRGPQVLVISPDKEHTFTLDLEKLDSKKVVVKISGIESVIGHDIKSTLKVLIELGAPMPAVSHDVMIGAFLFNSLRREQSLTDLATVDLGYEGAV